MHTARLAFAVSLLSLPSLTCERGLTEVRPPEAVPDFLGEYSGVYRGIETGRDDMSRTMVIQLGDKIAMSPFHLEDGTPRLSRFASVSTIPTGVTEPVRADTVVVLSVNETGMWPPGATCDPAENDSWASTPAPQLPQAAMKRVSECQLFPDTCDAVCYMPNLYEPQAGILGRCVGDGTVCSYSIPILGRVGRDVVELRFDQNTVAPPPEFDQLVCTEPLGDGWKRCTPTDSDCDHAACRFLDKLCDFDSRLAGVYQATLSATDGSERVVDLAVAIANNMPAVILFMSDADLGDRLFIGALEPATMEFRATDGEDPSDAGWAIRDGREPNIEVVGAVTEDAVAGLVRFDGTWTESYDDRTEVYSLVASRLSGVTPGAACPSMNECVASPLSCPLGNDVQIRGSRLQIETEVTETGCEMSRCFRSLDPMSLCEPLPSCGGRSLGDRVAETYDLWLSSPECPANDPGCRPGDRESCARFVCHDDAYGPASVANWYQVDLECGGPMLMGYEGQGAVRVECGGVTCPSTAPSCPMGFSNDIQTTVQPVVNDSGCVDWTCEQRFVLDDICAGVTPPTCGADEHLVPSIRVRDDPDPDCIELACETSCSAACSGCTSICGPFDPTSCADGVRVTSGCGGDCLELVCYE